MEEAKKEIRDDLHYYQKVREFIALSKEEKARLAKEFYKQDDFLDLRLDEVVDIINQTSETHYGEEEDWSQWLV